MNSTDVQRCFDKIFADFTPTHTHLPISFSSELSNDVGLSGRLLKAFIGLIQKTAFVGVNNIFYFDGFMRGH